MTKTSDGYFSTQVDLEDGVYQYKFRVQSKSWFLEPDEWVEVNDPYVTEIDPQSKNGIVRIHQGQRVVDTYTWRYDEHPLPANHELVIYEMHVADFSGGKGDRGARGTYQDVIDKLDYLQELGINAIELMPINEFPGNYSWGYKVQYFFACESTYGPPEDLKQLIDECHGRGIRVIMDGIYNHSHEESPLIFIDRDYWYHHGARNPDDPDNYWGPEFDYDHYDDNYNRHPAREFIRDVVRFWVQEYHIDGIRFDAVRQLQHFDFLGELAHIATEAAGPKPFYTIAEYIPETTSVTHPEGPLEGCWRESFRYFAIRHLCGEEFNLDKLQEILDAKRQGFAGTTSVIHYLASHDRDRSVSVYQECLQDKVPAGDNLTAAFGRAQLGAILLTTAVGVPLIWMGEEFGDTRCQEPNRPCKLTWAILEKDLNQELFDLYKGLVALRKQHVALHTANIAFFHINPEAKVLAYVRWHEVGARLVVVVNLSDEFFAGYEVPNFPAEGTWHEWTRNNDHEVQDGRLQVDLGAYEAQVFVQQAWLDSR